MKPDNDLDLGRCANCGITEHLNLLDSKSSRGDENGDFERLECIQCYGPDWMPCGGAQDFALSVAPSLKPLYRRWARDNPSNDNA